MVHGERLGVLPYFIKNLAPWVGHLLEVDPGGGGIRLHLIRTQPPRWGAFDTTWTMENMKKVLVFWGERCRIVELEGGERELLAKVRRLFKLSSEEIRLQVSRVYLAASWCEFVLIGR